MKPHDSNHNDPSDDLLDRSVAALQNAPVPEGPSRQTIADTLAALRRAAGGAAVPSSPARSTGFVQRILTMTFAHKRIAASVLLAVGGLSAWLVLTLFSSVGYADVAEKIRAAHTMTCTATISGAGLPQPMTMKMYFQDPGKIRFETAMAISIADSTPSTGATTLVLTPSMKLAQLIHVDSHSYGIQKDPLTEFRTLAAEKGEPIEDRQIGDVKAKGFLVKKDGQKMSLWVDPKTELPLRVEMREAVAGKEATVVLSEIVFDAKLDESLFSLTPPPGYTLGKSDLKISDNMEENITGLLRLFSKKKNGEFPARLDDWGAIAQLATPGDKPDQLDAESQELMSYTGAMHGLTFGREKGKDYDYRPGAKLGDADRIVFWYRVKDKETYRAVYGDLSVKDLKKEDVPPPVKEPEPNVAPPAPVPAQPQKASPPPPVKAAPPQSTLREKP